MVTHRTMCGPAMLLRGSRSCYPFPLLSAIPFPIPAFPPVVLPQAAAAAVFIRQTNAVWVLFASAVAAMHYLQVGIHPTPSDQPPNHQDMRLTDSSSQSLSSHEPPVTARASPHSESKDPVSEAAWDPSWATPAVQAGGNVPLAFLLLLLRVWQRLGSFLCSFLPLMAVVAGFAAFVVINGGIVVGDRSQHRMSLHFMQPLYCAACITLSLLPLILHPSSLLSLSHSLSHSLRKSPVRTLLLAAAAVLAIFFAITNYR